jgi:hypothetical protein
MNRFGQDVRSVFLACAETDEFRLRAKRSTHAYQIIKKSSRIKKSVFQEGFIMCSNFLLRMT